ncbi:sensor histidine kinase [Actinophytocola oryzae]|nr:histidine kinase [Actinophytocola oryzae]
MGVRERVLRLCLHAVGIGMVVSLEFVLPHHRTPAAGSVLVVAALAVWVVLAVLGRGLAQPWRMLGWALVLTIGAMCVGAGVTSSPILVSAGVLAVVSAVDVAVPLTAGVLPVAVVAYFVSLAIPAFHGTGDPFAVLFTVAIAAVIGFLSRNGTLERRTEQALARRRADAAVLGERARIARDLHDVLAHTLGGLVLQLDALDAVVSTRDDAEVATRVRRARAMAAGGLDEAKKAVDALRSFDDPLDVTLASLVDQAGMATGTPVRLTVTGDTDVPATVADVLASIAVEALTNTRKHAPGQPVRVELCGGGTAVALHVENPLTGPPTRGGHGLRGMRERAELVGSTLTAGPVGANWVVRCEVPRA